MARASAAWLLSTCPQRTVRDGRRALALALAANQMSRDKTAYYPIVVGVACAETADFKGAIDWHTSGMKLLHGKTELQRIAAELLILYRAGKPFHPPPGKLSNPFAP